MFPTAAYTTTHVIRGPIWNAESADVCLVPELCRAYDSVLYMSISKRVLVAPGEQRARPVGGSGRSGDQGFQLGGDDAFLARDAIAEREGVEAHPSPVTGDGKRLSPTIRLGTNPGERTLYRDRLARARSVLPTEGLNPRE
jgi:hypothetical protein